MTTAAPDTMQRLFMQIGAGAAPPQIGREVRASFTAVPKPATAKRWLQSTAERLASLPWNEINLPDDRRPPQPEAAAELMSLLKNVLDDSTPPPDSINVTSQGGIVAAWDRNGLDLEIVYDADGTATYSFQAPGGEEQEEHIGEDLTRLLALVRRLPKEQDHALQNPPDRTGSKTTNLY